MLFCPEGRCDILVRSGGKVMIFCGRKLAAMDYSDVVTFKVAVSRPTVPSRHDSTPNSHVKQPCGGGGVCSGRGTCAGAVCACYPGWTSPDCGEVSYEFLPLPASNSLRLLGIGMPSKMQLLRHLPLWLLQVLSRLSRKLLLPSPSFVSHQVVSRSV